MALLGWGWSWRRGVWRFLLGFQTRLEQVGMIVEGWKLGLRCRSRRSRRPSRCSRVWILWRLWCTWSVLDIR